MNLLKDPNKRKWVIVATMFIAIICNYLDRQLLSILKPEILEHFGIGDMQYAWIVNVFLICYALMYPVSGILVDRFGPKRVMLAGIAVWSLACIGGGLEQLTGWAMEELFNATSWTYEFLPDHITKWVAWRFLFFWGILGLVWARSVMPRLLYQIGMPTSKRQVLFVTLVAVYLVADIGMTLVCFNRKTARDAGVPAANAFERWVDTNYTDEFISSRFQNMVIESGAPQQDQSGEAAQ